MAQTNVGDDHETDFESDSESITVLPSRLRLQPGAPTVPSAAQSGTTHLLWPSCYTALTSVPSMYRLNENDKRMRRVVARRVPAETPWTSRDTSHLVRMR